METRLHRRVETYCRGEVQRIREVQQRNWAAFKKQPWQEMSGAFGDLGTFIPIFIALAAGGRASEIGGLDGIISVSSTLVFSGLANVITGMYFGIPLPVQPMKAIAAVAIANMRDPDAFGAAELASAGLFVAACVGLLSLTGLLQRFTRLVPVPVVKGIQMGAGLTLAMKAIPMLYEDYSTTGWADVTLKALFLFFVVLAATFLLAVTTFERIPFTLLVVGTLAALLSINGLVSLFTGDGTHHLHGFTLWNPLESLFVPEWARFVTGAFRAGLGQLPLTTLNSIVAVVYLAEDLFPDLEAPTATSIGLSVTLMNLVGCWFQAMPVCHGSGGLAAQYKFGARSGASIIFLGLLKLVLGLFASQFAVYFCVAFPPFLLGFLLFLAGLELARMGESINDKAARDLWVDAENDEDGEDDRIGSRKKFNAPSEEQKTRRWNIMVATIIGLLGAKNDGVGFVAGLSMCGAYNLHDWWAERAARRDGHIRLEHDEDTRQNNAEP